MSYFISSIKSKKNPLQSHALPSVLIKTVMESIDSDNFKTMKVSNFGEAPGAVGVLDVSAVLSQFEIDKDYDFNDLDRQVAIALSKVIISSGCSGDRHVFVDLAAKEVHLGRSVYFNENRVTKNTPWGDFFMKDAKEVIMSALEDAGFDRVEEEFNDERALTLNLKLIEEESIDAIVLNGKRFIPE